MSIEFKQASESVKTLTIKPSDEELLELYALYKQVTCGDCDIERPGLMDPKGRAKWDAWNAKKGQCAEVCQQAYIDRVKVLMS